MKLQVIAKLFSTALQTSLLVCCMQAATAAITDGTMQTPLTTIAGDPINGRAIVSNRNVGLCLLCHSASFAESTLQGNIAPSLDGAGSRYTPAQLRLRIVDSRRLNAASVMPAYYSVEGLTRVSVTSQNKPIFSPQQVEDVVAFLTTLK